MTHAFAIGYDWLYPALAPEDRALLRRAIVEKGLNAGLPIYERRPGWNDRGFWVVSPHNWNQVCNGGLTLGALAVADEEPEKSRKILRGALESIRVAMAGFNPDGGWTEGPGYWDYATRYNSYFLSGLETALGTDFGLASLPGFSKTGRFAVYFSGPSGNTFNYADAHEPILGAAQMFWMARRFSEPVYAWHQQRLLEAGPPREPPMGDAGEVALDLLWYQAEARSPQQAGWPLDAVFRSAEVAFLRSSWDDPDAIFVGVKGGDQTAGHAHLDLGSFVLDAGRLRWAMDLGAEIYSVPGYFTKASRWSYYRTRTESHNTVLIDGENQDLKAAASISGHRFQPELAFVRIDLSKANPGKVRRWERGVALAERRHVVVQDEITAEQPMEALWGMVTEAQVSLKGQSAELKKGDWVLSARVLSPQGAVFDVVSTKAPAPQNPNEGTRKLVVRLANKVSELRLVVALTPHRAGQPEPVLSWQDRGLEQW
jgi:hypothetical protein